MKRINKKKALHGPVVVTICVVVNKGVVVGGNPLVVGGRIVLVVTINIINMVVIKTRKTGMGEWKLQTR